MNELLLLLAVVLTTAGQLFQKLGADRGLGEARGASQILAVLFSWQILAAVACLVAGTLLWLVVLYRMDVSRAFPFLSLGYVLVLLVSRLVLRETIPTARWLGVGLIAAGIALVAQS